MLNLNQSLYSMNGDASHFKLKFLRPLNTYETLEITVKAGLGDFILSKFYISTLNTDGKIKVVNTGGYVISNDPNAGQIHILNDSIYIGKPSIYSLLSINNVYLFTKTAGFNAIDNVEITESTLPDSAVSITLKKLIAS